MGYLELEAGETVFNYGDVGDLFYIVISGEISVKTPFPEVLEDDTAQPYPVLIYFLNFFQDIDWSSLPDGNQIRLLIIEKIGKLGFNLQNDGSYELQSGKLF